ncbi:MAG: YigZ family protein [Gammaproteobacteria bacterium]|nr:YigZ family protein [Gammaproteobacteria bacterium]
MTIPSGYRVPAADIEVEEVIKGSRFITRIRNVATVAAAKNWLKTLREQEPTATHHCWAYIVGNPHSTTDLGCSDDGEPAGTAGKPMLNVLQHSHVGDLMAICTRYYGGTKLGTGGLARAYGGGVKLAMEQLTTCEKVVKVRLDATIDYDCGKDFEHLLQGHEGNILATDYGAQVNYQVELPKHQQEELQQQLEVRFGDKIQWKFTK